MISLAFVFFLVRSGTVLLGELSLDCDALSFRSVEPHAKGRGTMKLVGVGIAFARVPFDELAFATLGGTFAETDVLEVFVEVRIVCGAVVVGLARCVLPVEMVGFC